MEPLYRGGPAARPRRPDYRARSCRAERPADRPRPLAGRRTRRPGRPLPWQRSRPREDSVSEYVYSMYRADKFYGPDRQVLANISLSFFHGAKIGVLGPNGVGQVDAAADHGRARGDLERRGAARARARPSGCSSRSPSSTRPRTCAATSRTASASCATCSTASTRSRPPSPSPTPTTTRCSPSRRRCRTRSTAATPGRSTRRSTSRWTRCGCPTATAT